jgi:hypothetical protein
VVGGAATVVQAVFNVVPGADLADWAAELGGAALKQAASAIIWSEITKEFITVAIKAGSEPIIDATSTAADWVDGTIAGYDNYSSNNARSMGGVKLDAQQVAELNSQASIDEAYDVGRQSLAYKIFNTDYQGYVVNRLALATPSSIQDVSHNFTSTLAAIFPGSINSYVSFISKLLKPLTPVAIAGSGDADPVGAGVTQYGMTDELLNKYPDWKANENWVIAHLAAKGQSLMDPGADSSTELTDQNNDHDDDYHKFVRDCLLSDDKDVVNNQGGQCASDGFTQEERERYTVYRFDLGIGNENNSYNNDNNDQNPSSGNSAAGTITGNLTNPFPDGWSPGRLDMGYDGKFTGKVVSPCSGKMSYVDPDDSHGDNGGWRGAYFVVQCSSPLQGLPQRSFFFAEGIYPTVTQGQSVEAGQQIGKQGWTGYSEGPGGIEWGLATDDVPRAAYAATLGNSCASGSASNKFVLNFAKWVHDNLGVDPPATTDHAGCA